MITDYKYSTAKIVICNHYQDVLILTQTKQNRKFENLIYRLIYQDLLPQVPGNRRGRSFET